MLFSPLTLEWQENNKWTFLGDFKNYTENSFFLETVQLYILFMNDVFQSLFQFN